MALGSALQVKLGVADEDPEGEISAALPGDPTLKLKESLQGPYPLPFQVWIHHCPAPAASVVAGVIEQAPVPAGQPVWVEVYQVAYLNPVLSLTQR